MFSGNASGNTSSRAPSSTSGSTSSRAPSNASDNAPGGADRGTIQKSKRRKPGRKPKDRSKTAFIAEILGLAVGAFLLSFVLNAFIERITDQIPTYFGLPLVLVVILIGILGDGIGLASARAKKERLLAMASRKVYGAREALWFVRNAPRVSSVFNDLLGDVAATLSGAIAVALTFRLGKAVKGVSTALMASIGVGVVSALTVGGKALFKPFALRYAEAMTLFMGRTRRLMNRVLGGRQKQNER